jgi:hypothetical protein
MVFLGINIKGFKVANSEERQLREMINTPQGTIEVYEPTMDMLSDIIELQRTQNFGADTGTVSFDGIQVVRTLFPMLTNVDLSDSTDEELSEIIENPSVHLLIAQQVVAQIVAEANKLYAQRIKTELMNSESTMAQVELMNSIPSLLIEKAKGEGKVSELVQKVEEAGKELEEAIRKEQQEEPVDEPSI